MLDLNRAVWTRCGYPVVIYDRNVYGDESPFTVHGAFWVESAKRWYIAAWTKDGEYTPGEVGDLDLVNIPPTSNLAEPELPPSSVQGLSVFELQPAPSLSAEQEVFDLSRPTTEYL